MAINPRARAKFDQARAFVTVRAFSLNGSTIGPKQPFDKSSVTLRRLRQLYDQRYLIMVDAPPLPIAARFAVPPVEAYSDSELRKWLEDRDIVPRLKATRQKLLGLAREFIARPSHGLST